MHRRTDCSRQTWPPARHFRISLAVFIFIWGCAAKSNIVMIQDTSTAVEVDTIVSGNSGKTVSFEEMIVDLNTHQMIFVGEKHTNESQHANQLGIIKAVFKNNPSMVVGMEMFDRSYQPVLDLWSAGALDEETFLRKVHWYANWRFDFAWAI